MRASARDYVESIITTLSGLQDRSDDELEQFHSALYKVDDELDDILSYLKETKENS
jgi:hypothetical protein